MGLIGKSFRGRSRLTLIKATLTTLSTLIMLTSCYCQLIKEINRDYHGDIFLFSGNSIDCNESACSLDSRSAVPVTGHPCKCQCDPSNQVFREDLQQCVRELDDCPLVTFTRTYISETIPVVSLPTTGQLVHPGAHLNLENQPDLINSSCRVESDAMMTEQGWIPINSRPVFALIIDGSRSFLQWIGSESLRGSLEQKLVLIQFNCQLKPRYRSLEIAPYRPCAAVRIGWVPGSNFGRLASHANIGYHETNSQTTSRGKSGYLIIGLSIGILGLTYVLSLMIYLRSKRIESLKNGSSSYYTDSASAQTVNSSLERGNSTEKESNEKTIKLNNSSGSSDTNYDALMGKLSGQGTIVTKLSSLVSSTIDGHFPGATNNLSNSQKITNNSYQSSTKPLLTPSLSSSPSPASSTVPILPSSYSSNFCQVKMNDRHASVSGSNVQMDSPSIRRSIRLSKSDLTIVPKLLDHDSLCSQSSVEFIPRSREVTGSTRGRLRSFRFKPTLLVIPEDDYFYHENEIRYQKVKESRKFSSCSLHRSLAPSALSNYSSSLPWKSSVSQFYLNSESKKFSSLKKVHQNHIVQESVQNKIGSEKEFSQSNYSNDSLDIGKAESNYHHEAWGHRTSPRVSRREIVDRLSADEIVSNEHDSLNDLSDINENLFEIASGHVSLNIDDKENLENLSSEVERKLAQRFPLPEVIAQENVNHQSSSSSFNGKEDSPLKQLVQDLKQFTRKRKHSKHSANNLLADDSNWMLQSSNKFSQSFEIENNKHQEVLPSNRKLLSESVASSEVIGLSQLEGRYLNFNRFKTEDENRSTGSEIHDQRNAAIESWSLSSEISTASSSVYNSGSGGEAIINYTHTVDRHDNHYQFQFTQLPCSESYGAHKYSNQSKVSGDLTENSLTGSEDRSVSRLQLVQKYMVSGSIGDNFRETEDDDNYNDDDKNKQNNQSNIATDFSSAKAKDYLDQYLSDDGLSSASVSSIMFLESTVNSHYPSQQHLNQGKKLLTNQSSPATDKDEQNNSNGHNLTVKTESHLYQSSDRKNCSVGVDSNRQSNGVRLTRQTPVQKRHLPSNRLVTIA